MRILPLRARTAVAAIAGLTLLAPLIVTQSAHAAEPWDPYDEGLQNSNSELGYPRFVNGDRAIPDSGVAIDPTASYLGEVFAADQAGGAGRAPLEDYWVDRMLVRKGVQPDEPGGLSFNTSSPELINYDNNAVLFTRGRALYMEDSTAGLGFRGDVAYIDSLGNRSAYELSLRVDGRDVVLTEDTDRRHNAPSYWYGEFAGGGLRVAQTKFVNEQNVLVEWLRIRTTDGSTKDVQIRATSAFAGEADGDQLIGTFEAPNALTRVETALSGDGFALDGAAMSRQLQVSGAGADAKVQMAFATTEIPESTSEYERIRGLAPDAAFADQTARYNRWWVENVPYVETPSPEIDKSVFYRWWLLRTNFLDADIPGNDYQFPTTIEGVYGDAYNNAIVLTVGMFIDDLKYFRDPTSAYGSWISAGEVARQRQYIDNPGNPRNWSASYANFISESAWESYRVHGGDPSIAGKIADYAADDIQGQLDVFDGNGNGLIEYTNPAWTGNDVDAVSFSWRGPDPWHSTAMDRPESAYLYSGAVAAAEAYRLAGDDARAAEMDAQAERIKDAVLDVLWEDRRSAPDEAGFFGNMIKASYAANQYGAVAGSKIPWKEVNMFYPYTVGLMPQPGDADFDAKYLEAFRLFVDSEQYSPFPFYTANQADAKARAERDPGRIYSNNFSTINSNVMFRLLSSTLRDYPNDYLTADYYEKLLYWNAWASYEKGDVTRQNENEFWAHGSAADGGDIKYRSWIHQTQLGTTNFTVIEDVAGLQARADDVLELSPIDIGWDHFTVNNLRYHDRDLSIVWDEPGGERHYGSTPEGYSVYLDGERVLTLDSLQPVTFDPATGEAETDGEVLFSTTAQLAAADAVRYAADDRVTDVLAKAGVDIDPASSGAPNLAAGATVRASYEAPGTSGAGSSFAVAGAVDGSTVNEPFWGTAGSPNASDWLEVELDSPQPVDEAKVYFYRSSTSATVAGYAAPSLYAVEYWDGSGWVPVDRQARQPAVATGNLNEVRFQEVTAQRFRVVAHHASGAKTGIKEIQLRATGTAYEPAPNAAPQVTLDRQGVDGAPRIRFSGSVSDDGLPSGSLEQSWTVVSKPSDEARVGFSAAGSINTAVTFSEQGAYELAFTATDGAETTTVPVVHTVSGDLPPGPDLSATAELSASYTAPWNRVEALRDGVTIDRAEPDQAQLWGTFRNGVRPAQDTVTYTWSQPQRVAAVSAWFWNDAAQGTGAGVALPREWSIEWRDASGTWRAAETGRRPVEARGVESRATLTDPVQATAIRVTVAGSPGGGNHSAVALSELDVYTEAPESVEEIALRTRVGQPVTLPSTATIAYADGVRAAVPVEWEQVDRSRYDVPGRLTIGGVLAGSEIPVQAQVSVGDSSNDVASIEPQEARTFVNVAPDLPRTAVAVFAGGSGARESRSVVWDAVDASAYAEPGSFEVLGTMEGTGVRASVTVTVESDPDGDAPSTPAELGTSVDDRAVTARWTRTGTPVESYEVTLSPLRGGEEQRRTVSGTETEARFAELPVGEYRVSVRAVSGGQQSAPATIGVGVTGRPGAPTVSAEPALPDGEDGWYRSAPTLRSSIAPAELEEVAAPSASYTAPWNSLGAISDGAASNRGGEQSALWGSWSPTRPTSQQLSYEWAVPKVVSSSTVHFWSDTDAENTGDGVAAPRSWKLQYRDAAGAWIDVEAPSGFPIERSGGSTADFAPVQTTALRMVMEASTNGTSNAAIAVSEWSVLGHDAGDTLEVQRGAAWVPFAEATIVDGEGTEVAANVRTLTASGLASEPQSLTVKVDRTAPVVTVRSTNGVTSEQRPARIELSAADPISGVASLQHRLAEGDWTDTDGAIKIADVGEHVVEYRVSDRAGNTSPVRTVTVTVTEAAVEAAAPAAPLAPSAAVSGRDATVSWSAPADGGSAITGYRLLLTRDGEELAPIEVQGPVTSRTVEDLASGRYSAVIVAVNAVGASPASAASEEFVVTGEEPAATAPEAPATPTVRVEGRAATVSWGAPDDGGSPITAYLVTLSGAGEPVTIRTSDRSTTFGDLRDGAYAVEVRAVNAVGESAASGRAALTIAQDGGGGPTDPQPAPGEITVEGTPVVGGTIVVEGRGFTPGATARVELHSDPVLLGEVVVAADGTFRLEATVPDVPAGEHRIVVLVDGVTAAQQAVTVAADPTVRPPVSTPAGHEGSGLSDTGADGSALAGLLAVAMMLIITGAWMTAHRWRSAR